MPIILDVAARPDQQSFKRAADGFVAYATRAGAQASEGMSRSFAAGARDVQKATAGYVKAFDAVEDAAGRARTAEQQRQQLLAKGESLTKQLATAEEKHAAALNAEEQDTKALTAAAKELDRVKDQQARNNTALVRTTEAFGRAQRDQTRQINDAVAQYRELEAAQRRVANPTFAGSGSRGPGVFAGLASQSSGMVGQFSSLGGSSGKAFVAGAAAAIIAGNFVELGTRAAGMVMDGFKSVMDTGIDFQRTVNNFQGVTQSSPEDTARMAAAARALGSDTTLAGVSASDAAKGMTELAKAGFTVDEAMNAARGTVQLATAGQIDAAQAAEVQANAINAFKLNAGDAAHVADVLANAAVGSSADIPDLALALQQVGGIAHGFGVSLEDTVAALGMFANAGVKGSDAGTLLKTTMQSITDQGSPAQEAIKNLGLSLYDFNTKKFVGIPEMFRQLDEAKKRLSPQDFQAQANILFGSDAMRSAMLGSLDDFTKLENVINRTGTASQMAKAQMQGWPGIVEGISNTTEALKLSLFDIFNTPAGQDLGNEFVDSLDGLVEWVNTHKPEIITFFGDVMHAGVLMGQAIALQMGLTAGTFSVMLSQVGFVAKTMGDGLQKIAGPLQHIPDALLGPAGIALKKFGQDGGAAMSEFGANAQAGAGRLDELGRGAVDLATTTLPGLDARLQNAAGTMALNEQQNRLYQQSFKELAAAVELTPDNKNIVIKDNSPEVLDKLRQLGFTVQNLPDGRLTVRVDYRDPSGRVVDPNQLGVSQRQLDDRNSRQHDWTGPAAAPSTPDGPPPGGWQTIAPSGPKGDEPKPQFAENLWRVPAPTGGFVGPPVGPVDPSRVYDAESAEMTARNNYEQSRLRVLEMEAKGNVAQSELISARNQVQENERAWTKAQRELVEAQRGITKDATANAQALQGGMNQLGAALDNDLGISKGLPGLADNLMRFLMNIAAAPVLAQLDAVSKANPNQGSGIIGMLASSGAFGQQFLPTAGGGFASPSAMGPASLQPGASLPSAGATGAPSEDQVKQIAAQFGLQVTSEDRPGDPGYHGKGMALDISNGSGNTPEMRAFAEYMAANFGPSLKELIYSDGSFQGLIGDGQNVTGTGYYSAKTLGEHQNHVHVAAAWGQGGAATPPVGSDGAYAATGVLPSSAGGATPVYVVNMPGGGGGFPGLSGALSGAPASSAPVGPSRGPFSGGGGGSSSQDAVAANIIAQARARGLNQEQTLAALAVASQESDMGANPAAFRPQTQNGTPGITGVFQQDNSYAKYGDRNNPAVAATGFLDQFVNTGAGLNNPDPWAQALAVQRPASASNGGYDASTLRAGQRGTALDYYNRLGAGGGGGSLLPGTGMPQAAPFAGPGMAFSAGQSYPAQGGGGFAGIGGLPMAALSTAASMVPGMGAAAQVGMQLINRAIGYAGQSVGIGVSGLFETLSIGDNPLSSLGNSWFGKLASGFAGARPALPNKAGQAPPNPNSAQQGAQSGMQGGNTINNTVNLKNERASEDQTGGQVARHLESVYSQPGVQ